MASTVAPQASGANARPASDPGAGRYRNIQVGLFVLGGVLLPFGLLVIGLGWYGSAHTPYLYNQMSYLVSGGLMGLGLTFAGGFLYFGAWLAKMAADQRETSREISDALASLTDTLSRTGSPAAMGALLARPVAVPVSAAPGVGQGAGAQFVAPVPVAVAVPASTDVATGVAADGAADRAADGASGEASTDEPPAGEGLADEAAGTEASGPDQAAHEAGGEGDNVDGLRVNNDHVIVGSNGAVPAGHSGGEASHVAGQTLTETAVMAPLGTEVVYYAPVVAELAPGSTAVAVEDGNALVTVGSGTTVHRRDCQLIAHRTDIVYVGELTDTPPTCRVCRPAV